MNDKFKTAEILSSIDPIDQMEKQLGKRWDQFSEAEQTAMLLHSMNVFAMQRAADEIAGDTSMHTSFEKAEEILQSLGFQIGWMSWRTGKKYGFREKETIWCRPDGLIVHHESYHGTSTNGITLYGEIQPNFAIEDYYTNVSRICSGGGGYGFFPYGMDQPIEEKKIEFNADCRSGLRRKISIIPECGELLPVWENTSKHLWFLNYDEEKYFDNHENEEISTAKFREGTPLLKSIVKNFL